MAYIDYEFYTNRYQGASLSEFGYVSQQAEDFINYITNHQITEVTDTVKLACCAVAHRLYTFGTREGIKAENNDGYAVTYTDNLRSLLYQSAEQYLAPTGLLYRGVSL